ncbi:origin recognition complex subunit Orc4, putative [Paecilomyces variotii No. 5]|uniref:Origin recognition complex subunit 4 n=1 Tax=Byssochlamys spectabilis (strain No. 5 / NBRC 109023) TaxID=1356009 RepID=V5HVT5_BYSSN|nr:origin recognition complex subunit Orc4, putative [Paecilomyces variotii No. 5]
MGIAGKKRKLADARIKDEDGDETMHDADDGEAPGASPSPRGSGGRKGADTFTMNVDEGKEDNQESVTPTRSTRRRSAGRKAGQQIEEQTGNESEEATPPKSNTRSSTRQRKPPKKYEDTVVERRTPRSTRKNAATPSKEGRVTRSARRGVETPVAEDMNGDESPEPTATLSRRRSKRASVRFNTTETESTKDHDDEEQSENDDGQADSGIDGFADDLVAYQLQQDLVQNNVNGQEESSLAVEQLPDYAESFKALCQDGLQKELRLLSGLVLEKLTGKRPVPLKGLESEYQKTHQLIEHTASAGEGNSMLLLGSRGSGKTAMVETIISSLRKKHKEDFHVVRLNGFLHTDDRLALREIWRQLGRETNTEDEAAKVNNYADTMASLLALLSHPEELFGPSENGEAIATAKSVVIILDEFDLFVSHPRQTLLYNLFDIAQARKAPLAVIGITTKVEVTEMLEKRVKSRFSHRYVFLPLPRTFEVFSDVCYAGLGLEDDEITPDTLGSDSEAGDMTDTALLKSSGMKKLLSGWQEYLKGLWQDKDFQLHLQTIYHQTKSPKELFTSALVPLSAMHHSTYQESKDEDIDLEIPTPKSFTSHTLSCPDPAPLPFPPSSSISASTTPLPLSLLLAATRLTALHDPGSDAPQLLAPLAISFPAAYAEYVRLLTTAKASASASGATATPGRVWGRDIAREAWEKLAEWGVIVPVGGGANTADSRMFRIEVSFEEVVDMVGGGGALGRWWRDG